MGAAGGRVSRLVNLRLDDETIARIDARAKDQGYTDRSSWLRATILAALGSPAVRPRNASVAIPDARFGAMHRRPRT